MTELIRSQEALVSRISFLIGILVKMAVDKSARSDRGLWTDEGRFTVASALREFFKTLKAAQRLKLLPEELVFPARPELAELRKNLIDWGFIFSENEIRSKFVNFLKERKFPEGIAMLLELGTEHSDQRAEGQG